MTEGEFNDPLNLQGLFKKSPDNFSDPENRNSGDATKYITHWLIPSL
jgi:hypothetical protein